MPTWEPFWTEETAIESGGRYPLLLNRFHDHLEEYLIKGIVSITDRLRYVSYCCWIIGDIENTMDCKKCTDFEEAFRRRESALAIGTLLLNPESQIGKYTMYGREFLRPMIDGVSKKYNTTKSILPSNSLGAYGQYYKGTLQTWGLTYVNEDGIVCLTESGNTLYRIMDEYYHNSEYFRFHKGNSEVPGTVLKKWAEINHFDTIADDYHSAEREFYQNILFHLSDASTSDGRRDTLVIYMECINELSARGKPISINDFQNYLRNILYYEKYYDEDGTLYAFTVSPFLQNTRFMWMIYEIHVYYRWWIEEFFRMFLGLLKGSSNGMTVDEIIGIIDGDTFNETVQDYLEDDTDYLSQTFKTFNESVLRIKRKHPEWPIEEFISFSEYSGFSDIAAGLLMMISLLNDRFEQIKNEPLFIEDVRMKLTEDFWLKDIHDRIEYFNGLPLRDVLRMIINQIIISQHNKAMYDKRDLRRCWFSLSANKYQFHADSSSIWRPAKHNIICNFLYDMGLICLQDDGIFLTQEGKVLYQTLRDEYYEKQPDR